MIRIIITMLLVSISSFAQNRTNAEGKREGAWEGHYEKTGNLKYRGTFMNGIEQGIFTYFADQTKPKKISTLDYNKGNGNAYAVFYDEKGAKTSEGNYKNRKRDGKWLYYHPGGQYVLSEEYYIKDLLEGTKKVYYTDGKVSEELPYKEGKLNGILVKYAEDGVMLSEESYVNDVRHGKTIYRDRTGKTLAEGEYKNGLKIGAWANEKNPSVKPITK